MNTNPEYKKINLRKEYPGFVGNTDFAVISDLCEEELISKFPELECLQPFIIITVSQWNEISKAFGDFYRNNNKHQKRKTRKEDLFGYIGEGCSMNNANETRAEFNHLISVAKDTGCAIVIIAHMNKMKDTSPLYRTNGSIDIAGAARSILAVTKTGNKENPSERYLIQVKSNLAPMGSAIVFEVAENGVDFINEVELSADDAFSSLFPRRLYVVLVFARSCKTE